MNNVNTFRAMKDDGEKIVFLTAYDWMIARYVSAAGVDGFLVGDSLAQVFGGHESTLPVTLDEMIYHARAARRGAPDTFMVVDLPFLTFQIARLTAMGIPVMGHLGLTPQSIHAFGGYGLRGADDRAADGLTADARALTDAGCFAIVLEKIPRDLARRVTAEIPVPTIGIGAGAETDGQILVTQDVLGMTPEFRPKFVRRYANLDTSIDEALSAFVADVRDRKFPGDAESFS